MTKETKLVRVYLNDEEQLIEMRRDLTREKGEQASFADVIHWLLTCREETERWLETEMGYKISKK